MISIPVRSPRWTVRSNDWPANAFWWMRPSASAVEEAADARLELVDDARRVVDERPGELLVVEELAALERVLEMQIDRVARIEHGVVAALDHPRAAGPADRALADDGDLQLGRGRGGVQDAHQPGAAAADHRDVGRDRLDAPGPSGHPRPSSRQRRRRRIAPAGSRPFGQTAVQAWM